MTMTTVGLSAQSWSAIKSQPELYYFGEGWGDTGDEADAEALRSLMSQIKMNITVKNTQKEQYQNTNGEIVADNTFFESSFNSYGQATLENTMRIDLEQTPKRHVGRWIKRSDLDKIWESRRNKIHELIASAREGEQKGRVDVALRSYYWALALLRTMQQSGKEQFEGHTLMPWLRQQIDNVLCEVAIEPLQRKGDDVELMFTYKGKPVSSLDFTYNEGGYESALCSVKNGYGVMELTPGTDPTSYEITIETAYPGQTKFDPELQSVMQCVERINFPKATNKVRAIGQSAPAAPAPASTASFTSIAPNKFVRPAETSTSSVSSSMDEIIAAIRAKRLGEVSGLFEQDALADFSRLMRYGNAKVVGTPQITYMTTASGGIQARGLQLNFSFKNGVRRNFTESLVFNFNPAGKVDCVAFGLDRTSEDDIMGRRTYPEECRKLLVDFIQNYQTAFALKNLDFIESIFDDRALIIVGKVLKDAPSYDEGIRTMSGERYQYNRYTKKEYMSQLRNSFASKEFINLRFNHVSVRKSENGGEIYGIQLEQDYYSNNYCDHGYLFLEINLNDPQKPLILVRTWQPQPDPEFGLYDISSFEISDYVPAD